MRFVFLFWAVSAGGVKREGVGGGVHNHSNSSSACLDILENDECVVR